jgi:acyl dehydratase
MSLTRSFASLEEVEAALGLELGPSPPVVIDQGRIDAFADATGDHQWIHVDPARAAGGPFGATIAHGYLTLSLIACFAQTLFRLDFGRARVNYGVNTVRFPAAVPAGAALQARATFVDLRQRPAGATLTTRYVIELEGGSKPACVAETLTLLA